MIFLHEIHEISGGRMAEFEESFRQVWKPAIEAEGDARILWFWHHTHGTGPAYQAVSISAVRDWETWGRLVARMRQPGDLRDWTREVCTLRREVTSKVLVPAQWSPIQEVDLSGELGGSADPVLHLHDTGWPFPGKLDDYVGALGSIFLPLTKQSQMISVEACWVVAPGTGRFHEVVLLQRILDWQRFSRLLTEGESVAARNNPWMRQGLGFRDRWESKLLRTARWSPSPAPVRTPTGVA